MKLFISISIFLSSISLVFSQDYDKKNSYGQKTGEWVEYYPVGYIKQIVHYTPFKFRLDTFLIPDATLESYDTIIAPNPEYVKTDYGYVATSTLRDGLPSKRDWWKTFEYDPSWQLKRVVKIDSSRTYLYGNQQEIGLVNHKFEFEGIVGKSYQIKVLINNFSDRNVPLSFENLTENMTTSAVYVVPPNSEYDVILNIEPEPNFHTYNIELIGDSFTIDLMVNTEAYHYKTSDFESDTPIIITHRNLVIKRENSEALLTILSSDNERAILQISLNRELAQINLTELIPGEYIFMFTDFTNNSKILKKIELK